MRGLERALSRFRTQAPPLILVAGRGTSDNAAVYGRYLFEHFVGIPGLRRGALSVHALSRPHARERCALHRRLPIRRKPGRRQGAAVGTARAARYTVAITNVADSSLARAADYTCSFMPTKKPLWPPPKTYTAELVAMAMICRAIGGRLDPRHVAEIPKSLAPPSPASPPSRTSLPTSATPRTASASPAVSTSPPPARSHSSSRKPATSPPRACRPPISCTALSRC